MGRHNWYVLVEHLRVSAMHNIVTYLKIIERNLFIDRKKSKTEYYASNKEGYSNDSFLIE